MTQPGPRPATAVTVFHADGDDAEFTRWAARLLESARDAHGHLSSRVSDVVDVTSDRAVAVTFCDDAALHRWLDSPDREAVLCDGRARGFWTATPDVVTTADNVQASGIGVFGHVVAAGCDDEFRATQARLSRAAATQPGYLGTVLVAGEQDGEWTSVVRFRTGAQLAQWLASAERGAALEQMRGTLSRDFSTGTTPFGTTVRVQDGQTLMTPNWKSAMLVLAVLYPTVMLLSRFLGPVVDHAGAPPWLALWISQIVSIVAMQWWLMPAASRPLRRWLDPVDGAGARVSGVGVAVILVVYAVTLTVFASVHELQFWDYAS